ncbi:hypothetical protein AKJ51_02465 [candidate division MSBL1 archaeon SCGC-AAA382A20]|uniref:Uncharacterized protein n=1 Tax=candidate division MSBL1 archaeon SCGC-AAA382A20 TaxID=1698280 RepID=A0A133VKI0_9EURY|nr:hypothetical protein AKJ51_02465 [candidate division MSBL1 archaeon SCGC-AAA382A20]
MKFSEKRYWILIITVSLVACFATYLMIGLYGQDRTGEEILIEKGAEQVKMDNRTYFVVTVENISDKNALRVNLKEIENENISENAGKSYTPSESGENRFRAELELEISKDVYTRSVETPILIKKEEEERSSEPTNWMFSLTVGIAVFGILSAVHLRNPETRGKAATLLLENGRDDARVRDVEILATIMKMGEFTIPEVMRKVGTSKTTTYRTINDFVDLDLVEKTEENDMNNGRGKPSQVYEFKGERDE